MTDRILPAVLVPGQPSEEKTCHICMEELDSGTEIAMTIPGCKHVFGSECLANWLKGQNTCPMCRRELFPKLQNLGIRLNPFELMEMHERGLLAQSSRDSTNNVHSTSPSSAFFGPTRGLIHMRQWLRRRMEPNPPYHGHEITHWFRNQRRPSSLFATTAGPVDRTRMRWTNLREADLYEQLRRAGAPLPPAHQALRGEPFTQQQEEAFLAELVARGAFLAAPGTTWAVWQRGVMADDVWRVFREEGYVYAGCFGEPPRRSYYGWVGMRRDGEARPPRLETGSMYD